MSEVTPLEIARRTLQRSRKHSILQWGAALAFYSAISLAPLLLILLSVVGPWLGEGQLQREIERHAGELLGPSGDVLVASIVDDVRDRRALPRGIAFFALVGGATLFFAQIQNALHHVWEIEPRQRRIWRYLRRRAKAIVLGATLAVLLAASIFTDAALSGAIELLGIDAVASVRNAASLSGVGSILLFGLLVGVLYKTLPDARLEWSDVAVGVAVTTGLFALGRWLSGLYVARLLLVSSLYGAAGSLIVFLFWLYYTSVTALVAAELTAVWAEARGRPLRPRARGRGRDDEG